MGNSTAFTMRTLHHPQQQQGQHDEPDADADAGGKHDGAVALAFQLVKPRHRFVVPFLRHLNKIVEHRRIIDRAGSARSDDSALIRCI